MRALHFGLGASSEKNADLFFAELLGLAKTGPVKLPAELCRGAFGLDRELAVVNFRAEGVHFEVFLDPQFRATGAAVIHACLEVEDQNGFLQRCEARGLRVSRTPKGNSVVVFVTDLDGNRYEIKGAVLNPPV